MRGSLVPLLLILSLSLGCSQPPEGESGGDLPPVGQDPAFASFRAEPYADLRRHTHHTAGATEDPELSSDGRTLYYASTHDTLDFNIYSTLLDSSLARRLTASPADERQPRVSPDGRWLAYISNEPGYWDIHILSLTDPNSPPRRVVPRPGDKFGPGWDPEGRHLVYSAVSPQTGWFQLYTVEVATGRETAFDPRLPGLFPQFSPDGRWIAFNKFKERGMGYSSLWLMRPDGTEPTEILAQEAWGAITPAWSPDGSRLAYASVGKSPEWRGAGFRADDVWVVPREGGPITQLTTHPASDWSPLWSGDRIYFVSSRSGTPNIWSLPAP